MQYKKKYSFSKNRRLRSSIDFDLVLKSNSVSNRWFILSGQKNNLDYSRLGIIASKRVIPKANARNFAKRLIREVFRNSNLSCACDVVIRVRRRLSAETAQDGRTALNQLLVNYYQSCAEC